MTLWRSSPDYSVCIHQGNTSTPDKKTAKLTRAEHEKKTHFHQAERLQELHECRNIQSDRLCGRPVRDNLMSVQPARIPHRFTASLKFFTAGTRTVIMDVGYVLKTQGSVVCGFTPVRASVASFVFNLDTSMPTSLDKPCRQTTHPHSLDKRPGHKTSKIAKAHYHQRTPVIVALMSNWSGRHIHDSSTTTGIKTVPCKRTLTNDSTSMETVSREHAITRITRAADPNAKAFPVTAVVLPAASGARWEPGPAQQVATSQKCRSVV